MQLTHINLTDNEIVTKDPNAQHIKEDHRTIKARKKIYDILKRQGFTKIIEEKVWPNLTNGTGDVIKPPYQSDILATKIFSIELDPVQIHGSKIKRGKDIKKDRTIYENRNVKTVRLIPRDILKQTEMEIIQEIEYQLENFEKRIK